MKNLPRRTPALIALVAAISAPVVTAESLNPVLDDKLTLKLGAIYNTADAKITVSVAPLPPTPIDLDFLGIEDNQTSVWLAGRWRFGQKWALNFSFDRFDESGNAIAEENFNFDGEIYPVGAALDTSLRADAYIMDVSYSIWKESNYEAGLGLGLHAFNLKTSIDATFFIGDETEVFQAESDDLLAPVPNLRLFGTYAFNPKVSMTVNAGWLSLTYEDWDGNFWYFAPSLDYRFGESFGAGIGYRYTDIDVEHDSGGGDFEEYNMEFNGATAYISYSF